MSFKPTGSLKYTLHFMHQVFPKGKHQIKIKDKKENGKHGQRNEDKCQAVRKYKWVYIQCIYISGGQD